MIGLADGWIVLAFLLCILSVIACVVYGVINWNRGSEKEKDQVEEERTWEKAEKKIEERM